MMVSVEEEQPLNRDRYDSNWQNKNHYLYVFNILNSYAIHQDQGHCGMICKHHRFMLEVVSGCTDPLSRKFADSGDLPTILPVLK